MSAIASDTRFSISLRARRRLLHRLGTEEQDSYPFPCLPSQTVDIGLDGMKILGLWELETNTEPNKQTFLQSVTILARTLGQQHIAPSMSMEPCTIDLAD